MDINEVWTRLIACLKENPNINASQIDAFFSRLQIQAVSPGFIMFTSENEFIKNWVATHFHDDIHRALEELYGVDFFIQFETDTTMQHNPTDQFQLENEADAPQQRAPFMAAPGSNNASSHEMTAVTMEMGVDETGNPFSSIDSGDSDSPHQANIHQTTETNVNQIPTDFGNQTEIDSSLAEDLDSTAAYRDNPLTSDVDGPDGESAFVRRIPPALSTQRSEFDLYQKMLAQSHANDMLRQVPNMVNVQAFQGQTQYRPMHQTGTSRMDAGLVDNSNGPDQTQGNQAALPGNNEVNLMSFAPSLTFDNFVIGTSNRLAYSMAQEVAERPGKTNMNPLFIYGRSGVGKTHLLCAIQNYIREQYPELSVIYIDSNELVNRYSDTAIEKSVDKRSFKNFENYFLAADVLLIDDVQGLQGKRGTLDMVFQIFNKMIANDKQMVFAADRAPKNIDLDERYISRFNQGVEIDIQPPDDETKRSIVRSFVMQCQEEEDFEIKLSDDDIDYIVENSSSNIREVKSAITKVVFAMKMKDSKELTPQDVKDLLGNHFISEGKARITPEGIQRAVESFYQVSHADLVGKRRSKEIKHPRQVAIYLMRELVDGSTYKAIGKIFNRDHSTIMHSYDVVKQGLKEDRNLREEIEAIREKIRIDEC